MSRPTLAPRERILPCSPGPRKGMSLLTQGLILVAAAAAAGLLGYWAAEALKGRNGQTSAGKPAAVSSAPGQQSSQPSSPAGKGPCVDCENRSLPTP